MRKIDLSTYDVQVQQPDGTVVDVAYQTRASIIALLFTTANLSAVELLERDDLAHKIQRWPDEALLLEEAEYTKLTSAIGAFKGFSRNDAELVRRVLKAEPIEVQAKE